MSIFLYTTGVLVHNFKSLTPTLQPSCSWLCADSITRRPLKSWEEAIGFICAMVLTCPDILEAYQSYEIFAYSLSDAHLLIFK